MFKSLAFAAVSITSVQAFTDAFDDAAKSLTCYTTVDGSFFQLKDLASEGSVGHTLTVETTPGNTINFTFDYCTPFAADTFTYTAGGKNYEGPYYAKANE